MERCTLRLRWIRSGATHTDSGSTRSRPCGGAGGPRRPGRGCVPIILSTAGCVYACLCVYASSHTRMCMHMAPGTVHARASITGARSRGPRRACGAQGRGSARGRPAARPTRPAHVTRHPPTPPLARENPPPRAREDSWGPPRAGGSRPAVCLSEPWAGERPRARERTRGGRRIAASVGPSAEDSLEPRAYCHSTPALCDASDEALLPHRRAPAAGAPLAGAGRSRPAAAAPSRPSPGCPTTPGSSRGQPPARRACGRRRCAAEPQLRLVG